ENVEIALHHLGEPLGGDIAELVLGREALAGLGHILEARVFSQAQFAALQRWLLADLCSERAEGGNELTRDALVGAENLGRNVGLPPVEVAFPDKAERIGEIVQTRTEFPHGKQKLIG